MEQDPLKKNVLRPIGSYLARERAAAVLSIDLALARQATLEKLGISKPLGRILAEENGLGATELEECLLKQRTDILAAVPLFELLPRPFLDELARSTRTVVLPPGAEVYRASEASGIYWVVASGSVRIFRREASGEEITLAHRGPGEGFGEIATLTGRAHTTTAETLERTALILIPADIFLKIIFAHPQAGQACARTLAERLAGGYDRIASSSVSEQAYRQFIAERFSKEEPLFIGNSPAVMKLISECEALAGSDKPALIFGEPGTELSDVAGLLHEMSRKGAGLFLTMDAMSGDGIAAQVPAGSEPLLLELTQYSTLFGRDRNALPFAPDRRLGLLAMAANGTVMIGNIEYLTPLVQGKLADYLETGKFSAAGEQEVLWSNARVLAATNADLAVRVAEGTFDRRLHGLLAGSVLMVPPLRQRKRDIRITADELIRRNSQQLGKNIRGIDEEAYQALMGYDWPGNTEELRVVIRRAVSIARNDTLALEDIFIGPPPVTGKFTIDLLKFGPVRKLLESGFYPTAAHFITIPFIGVIVGLGLFGPQDPDRNLALILTWGLWEPMLVLSAFFASRIWCSVCPMGAISRLVNRSAGLRLKVPLWLRNYGFLFTAAGIGTIFWLETAADMPRSPRATALLVVPLVLFAALAGLLFQRRAWCRYLCPLGGMMGVFGTTAIVEMRSNYAVCNSTCVKHECYAGTAEREGCPMFEGPFALSSNRTCMLCGNCTKICPNHSPVLNLRLPGYELWTVQRPDWIFSILVIAVMGTQVFRGMENHGLFHLLRGSTATWWLGTLAALGVGMVVAWGVSVLLGRVVLGSAGRGEELGTCRIAYVMLPLVFTFEAAFHLRRMLTLAGQFLPVLGRELGLGMELPGASAPLWLIKSVQALLLLAGLAASLGVLHQQRKRFKEIAGGNAWPLLLLAAAYLFLLVGA